MVSIKFVSELQAEVDVVAIGMTFKRGETREVTEEDADLLLRSSSFVRIDGDAPDVAPPSQPASAAIDASKSDASASTASTVVSKPSAQS